MATGVLVVAVEDGTKLVPWLTADDKAYEATIRLGIATDSFDADGVETARAEIDDELRAELDAIAAMTGGSTTSLPPRIARALDAERARTMQVPPAISAIRIGGERAHDLVRRGEAPELAAREIGVRRIDIVGGGLDPDPHLRVVVDVAKGYFVRSLARDLAEALGTFGHLTALRRTRSGAFTLDDAVALDASPEALREALLPLARAAARALPVSVLTPEAVTAAGHGQRLMPGQVKDPHAAPSAWLDESGALVAVGTVEADGSGRVLRGFARPAS
ncbi:MAG: tRNA pseudouridine synthase, partial [Labilithrix sp.]|nr:tRNA pseudouridine synthase [Labilithrix sp.]